MTMYGQTYHALLRAARHNPLWQTAQILRVQRDANGAAIMNPDGTFAHHVTGQAYVAFDFEATGVPSVLSEYVSTSGGEYRVIVLPVYETLHPLTLPDLNGSFALRMEQPDMNPAFPPLSLMVQRVGGSGMGYPLKYEAKTITPDDLGVMLEP